MYVIKRNGTHEQVSFDKILNRVRVLSSDLRVEPVTVAKTVVAGLCEGITTRETDELLVRKKSAGVVLMARAINGTKQQRTKY